jgi:hypothetical protein
MYGVCATGASQYPKNLSLTPFINEVFVQYARTASLFVRSGSAGWAFAFFSFVVFLALEMYSGSSMELKWLLIFYPIVLSNYQDLPS